MLADLVPLEEVTLSLPFSDDMVMSYGAKNRLSWLSSRGILLIGIPR